MEILYPERVSATTLALLTKDETGTVINNVTGARLFEAVLKKGTMVKLIKVFQSHRWDTVEVLYRVDSNGYLYDVSVH